MTCFRLLQAFRLKKENSISKEKDIIAFSYMPPPWEPFMLPCGRCFGCRAEYARQWGIRCVHESKLYDKNCFITLTFDDEHLYQRKNPYSLDKKDFQKFMKRLRKRFPDLKIRYFHGGEYGDKKGRPHYHACIFNFDFPDKKFHKKRGNHVLYTSKILEELWPYGYSSVGSLTFESANYVAKYCCKKFSNKDKEVVREYYAVKDDAGKVYDCIPEYGTMSRNGGIGKEFYNLFGHTFYPRDSIGIRDGVKCKPPKYYDTLYELTKPSAMAIIRRRRSDVFKDIDYSEFERELRAKEVNMKAKFALFCKRTLNR